MRRHDLRRAGRVRAGRSFVASTHVGSRDLVFFLQGGGRAGTISSRRDHGTIGVPPVDILDHEQAVSDWNVTYLPYCDGSLSLRCRPRR